MIVLSHHFFLSVSEQNMYSDSSWQQSSSSNPYRKSSKGQPPNNYGQNHSGGRRPSNDAGRGGLTSSFLAESNQRDLQETFCSIVQRSRALGVKKESKQEAGAFRNEASEQGSGPSSSTSPIPSQPKLMLSPATALEDDPANGMLPPFDLLTNLPPTMQCRKFFDDLRPLDRILARIVRPGVAVLHLELVCMLTRFRRTLLSFMKGKLIPVPFDRTKRFYQVNDYISTTVVSISPNSEELELEIDEEEAILTQQGIPAYCRDFDRTTFEDERQLASLRDNPNLAAKIGVDFNSVHSALSSLYNKHLEFAPSAVQLRKEQTAKLAMIHVRKGAELTRENKCFEAIQCFNKALNVDSECADAFVGRGAACAGNRNFPAALLDLERAIDLQPEHRNANKYRIEVLYTFGKELERSGDLAGAREKFKKLLALCPGGHQGAMDGLQRLNSAEPNEVVELSEDEADKEEEDNGGKGRSNGFDREKPTELKRKSESMSEEEAQRNRQKLAEMEAFIAKLKGGKK